VRLIDEGCNFIGAFTALRLAGPSIVVGPTSPLFE